MQARRSSATSRVPCLAYSSLQWAPVSCSSYQSPIAIHNAIATICRQRHLDTKQIVFTDGFFCPFKFCESILHHCKVKYIPLTGSPALLDLRLVLVPALMWVCWHGWQHQMVSVVDDDHHVSIIVYFSCSQHSLCLNISHCYTTITSSNW